MPKIKTKKTLMKRIKVTKKGKILKGQTRTGHLKVKWSANRKYRKKQLETQDNAGHIKVLKKLLGKHSKGVK